jgi:GT2 family glycosyltransferase
MPYDVCALVVTHNSENTIGACLASLAAHQGGASLATVVLDCASSDRTVERARSHGVIVLERANIGYGAGNNLAAAHPNARSSRYLLVLNPDVAVASGSLNDWLDFADTQPQAGVFAPRAVDENGVAQQNLVDFHSPRQRLAAGRAAGAPSRWHSLLPGASCSFGWAVGYALLLRRSCFDALDGFDERFFMYADEVDLQTRSHYAGYEHLASSQLTVCHSMAGRSPSPKLMAQMVRANLLYGLTWGGRGGLLVERVLWAGDALRALTHHPFGAYAHEQLSGLCEALTARVPRDPVAAREWQRRRFSS